MDATDYARLAWQRWCDSPALLPDGVTCGGHLRGIIAGVVEEAVGPWRQRALAAETELALQRRAGGGQS